MPSPGWRLALAFVAGAIAMLVGMKLIPASGIPAAGTTSIPLDPGAGGCLAAFPRQADSRTNLLRDAAFPERARPGRARSSHTELFQDCGFPGTAATQANFRNRTVHLQPQLRRFGHRRGHFPGFTPALDPRFLSLSTKSSLDLTAVDLRNHNVIMVGKPDMDGGIQRFLARSELVDLKGRIRNIHPAAGEQAEYVDQNDPVEQDRWGRQLCRDYIYAGCGSEQLYSLSDRRRL